MARIPKDIRVGKNDEILPYVLLTNSHDGTSRACIIPTTILACFSNVAAAHVPVHNINIAPSIMRFIILSPSRVTALLAG
jgi:hypothetical protein